MQKIVLSDFSENSMSINELRHIFGGKGKAEEKKTCTSTNGTRTYCKGNDTDRSTQDNDRKGNFSNIDECECDCKCGNKGEK